MRTDDSVMSSATSGTYIQWVILDKLGLDESDWKKYNFLINTLAKIEFTWIHPRDENRAKDGLSLREDFTYETGLFLDSSSGLTPKCSVLEMMAALSIRIENQIMRNLSEGDRTSKWFLAMICNLDLGNCINKNWKYDYDAYIKERVEKFLRRDYESNGKGGLFPLKNDTDIRQEEIWKQCMMWLNENFGKESSGELTLYS